MLYVRDRYDVLTIKAMAAGSMVNNLNKELAGNTYVKYTMLDEQAKIGKYFTNKSVMNYKALRNLCYKICLFSMEMIMYKSI